MNQTKQNIWVVAILFFSLLSSVAFSYVITPTSKTMTEMKQVEKTIKAENKSKKMKKMLTLLLPKVGK
ncbi:MAG: hypothetical protein ACSHWU_07335 [Marinicella sp.]